MNFSVNIEKYFSYTFSCCLHEPNVKALKKCMYFWVPIISCSNLTLLYINPKTNGIVPVVQTSILDIILLVKSSLLCEYFLVESLVYFSILHHRFTSLF